MASAEVYNENSSNIPLNEMNVELIEDDYGYVDPSGHSQGISKDIMMQLPSHHLDDVTDSTEDNSYGTRMRKKTLKRSETLYKTMNLRRVTMISWTMEDDVDKVYKLLTSDCDITSDSLKSDLRDMHQSLTLKRMVKAKIDSKQQDKIRMSSLSCWLRCHSRLTVGWHHFKYRVHDITCSLELWNRSIKKIQGHFGSGVASYFIFLRWLLYLNIFNFVISFFFIIIPQLVYEKSNSDQNKDFDKISFNGFDLLTGSGWLGNSSFFYGYYTNETIETVEGYRYDMPLAYLSTVGIAAVINLIVVAYCVTKSYQTIYVNSTGPLRNKLCGKIFCAWDYTIEKYDTAMLQHHLIYNDLKEFLNLDRKSQASDFRHTLLRFLISTVVNIAVITAIIGIGILVHFILENKAVEVETEVLKNMTLALTITAISFIFHYLITYVTKLEYFFSEHVRLYLKLGRVAVLRLMILSILVYFWIIIPRAKDTKCISCLLSKLLIFTYFGPKATKLPLSQILAIDNKFNFLTNWTLLPI